MTRRRLIICECGHQEKKEFEGVAKDFDWNATNDAIREILNSQPTHCPGCDKVISKSNSKLGLRLK